MQFTEKIKELITISHNAGNRVDYTQGGGGNTSVKLSDNLMAIKASGFKLTDISENSGYVVVDYKKIAEYYNNVDLKSGADFEAESLKLALSSVVALENLPQNLRPSVEVGFHAILRNYVVHTHSVYANILTCSKEGKELAEKILKGYDFIFLPYINPGFTLTVEMNKEINKYFQKTGRKPKIIFMINHGVVVNADTAEEADKIHKELNDKIIKYFKLPAFPQIVLKNAAGRFVSGTSIVNENLSKANIEALEKTALYPDQLVYLNNTLKLSKDKMQINSKITYNTTEKEARVLEETLAAYLYVLKCVESLKLTLTVMSKKDKDFIDNWESEKYRKAMVK